MVHTVRKINIISRWTLWKSTICKISKIDAANFTNATSEKIFYM